MGLMRGKGYCYNNVVVENIYLMLKTALADGIRLLSRAQVSQALLNDIDVFYNHHHHYFT